MKSLGDFDASAVIYGKFCTYQPSTGAAFALAGTPALSVYKDNSTTQSTSGVTLTASFDSVTGLNHFAIDTSSDGTFYSAGSFFDIVITTGTVDSVSVVGTVVASFTIRKNSALKPATAGRTVVVDASGLVDANTVKVGPTGSGTAQTARDIGASVLLSSGTGTGQVKLSSGYIAPNWGDVGNPTTTLNLSGTTIATTQKVDVDTIKTNPVINAGTITFPTGATLASTTNITAGTITTATNLTNAPTSGDFTSTMKTSIGTAVAASAVASVTAGVTLADDAITASKFDESTAFPIKSADTGSTQIARTGADSDTLETLSDQLDGMSASAIAAAMFTADTGQTYAGADANSVVKQIADNAGGSSLSVQDIVDGVWDEPQSAHTDSGTFGEYLDSAVSGVSTGGVTAADIADAVLDEAMAGHTASGTLGKAIADILVDTAEIGTAGAGLTEAGGTGDHLTAIPWNSAWDAEVQSEAADALVAYDPPTYTEMTAGFAGLNDLSAAEVNAEVVDVMTTDTHAEPTAGAPGATISYGKKIDYLYKWTRNKSDNDGTQNNYYNDDASTVDHIQTTSTSGGTSTLGEMSAP